MSLFRDIYNNTRYIVFIQTKYHQNILPANDVSVASLTALLKTIGSHSGGIFRSIRIRRDDIVTLRIYEMNFMNYKNNVLSISHGWQKTYHKLSIISGLLNLLMYNFTYKREVNKFGTTITNAKPKYLIDKTAEALNILYGERREYHKNNEGKEIIEDTDCINGNIIINEEIVKVKKDSKSSYFLNIYIKCIEKYESPIIDLGDFIDIYEENVHNDGYSDEYLNLSAENIRKSYIKTINNQVLKKYDKEIMVIKDYQIRIIQDSK